MFKKFRKPDSYQSSLIICFLFFMMMHIATFASFGDDATYCHVWGRIPLFQWLMERYEHWSSRLFIDAITVMVAAELWIWQLIDILMWVVLYANLHYLCFGKKRNTNSYLLLLLLMSYPFAHMGSSGWIATTVNYLWPISILLYPFNALIRQLREENVEIKWYQYVFYIIAIFFGCSNELGAFISFCCFTVLWVAVKKTNKSFSKWYFICAILISVSNLIFIFTCPGNANRLLVEAENFMPEFSQLSLPHILILNYIAIFEHFVSKPNALFFLLVLILQLGTIRNTKAIWKRVVAAIPMIFDVLFSVC